MMQLYAFMQKKKKGALLTELQRIAKLIMSDHRAKMIIIYIYFLVIYYSL